MSEKKLFGFSKKKRNITKVDNPGVSGTYTYNSKGQIATIMQNNKDGSSGRVITQYDENGRVTISQHLGPEDIVNFSDGYIASIVKYDGGATYQGFTVSNSQRSRTTLQYGKNGRLLSSVQETAFDHKDAIGDRPSGMFWLTTSTSTYYDNGHLATHVTYAQKPTRARGLLESLEGSTGPHEVAESYISAIEQMDENGKVLLSLRLHEFDEVNYHPSGRVATVLKKDKDNNPKSLTSYDENGKISNIMVYKDGVVISSTDYVDGHPVSNTQQGNNEYQNIFDAAKKRVKNKTDKNKDNVVVKPENVLER